MTTTTTTTATTTMAHSTATATTIENISTTKMLRGFPRKFVAYLQNKKKPRFHSSCLFQPMGTFLTGQLTVPSRCLPCGVLVFLHFHATTLCSFAILSFVRNAKGGVSSYRFLSHDLAFPLLQPCHLKALYRHDELTSTR